MAHFTHRELAIIALLLDEEEEEENIAMMLEWGKHSKKSKKHKRYSKVQESDSSSDEWVEAETINKSKKYSSRKRRKHTSSESSAEETIKKRKSRRGKDESSDDSSYDSSSSDEKRRKSKKKSTPPQHRSSSDTSDDMVSGQGRNKLTDKRPIDSKTVSNVGQAESKRDDWMNLSTNFASFSNIDRKRQREGEKKQQKQDEQYNPSKCTRELNPYWKNGGDGLPTFQKPRDDDSDDHSRRYDRKSSYLKPQSSWRKTKTKEVALDSRINKAATSKSEDSVRKDDKNSAQGDKKHNVDQTSTEKAITEKELNLLAGKLIKAEIMGNEKLVKELKEKLESGRKALTETKIQDEGVLLTQTDRQGHSKPLTLQSEHEEGSSNKKQRKKVMDTHKDQQRVRYFPDDDKYSLKQMFENEKFSSANDQDSEFMKIASNIRKNDDLDDLFADNVRRKKSDAKIDEANHSKAVSEHQKISDRLDNCSKCIQSNSMQKHLIISMGEYIYLSLPAHEPLLEGHCLIIPIRHVPSVTLLDENEWSEIREFRMALVRLFASKDEQPIFFETATGFQKYPHMVLECVPLPKDEGSMAPIYFKKAIDESEIEWTQNKKLVSLKGRDVRRAVPKGLPYFFVSFGMEEGFAHVIEDDKLFPRNFAQEIIGGILDLHHSKWRKPSRQSFDVQSKSVLKFSNEWREFDCTASK